MMTQNQKLGFMSNWRQAITQLIEASQRLDVLRGEYDALDIGTQVVDSDFEKSEHEGLAKDDFVSSVAVVDGILKGVTGEAKTIVYRMKL